MAKAGLKTVRTNASVDAFVAGIAAERQQDCRELIGLMSKAAGAGPQMWGPAIIGFGQCRYRYPDGREMDWMLIAFSPRKAEFALYLMADFAGKRALMARLGTHKTSKFCLYVKRLADVDRGVLQKLLAGSVAAAREQYA